MSFLAWFIQALIIFYGLLFVHAVVQRVIGYARLRRATV